MGWSPAKVGMAIFLCNEAVFFATLVLAYITYIGATTSGPTPAESLSLPLAIVNSVLLIASSVTVTFAVKAMEQKSDDSNDWTNDFAFWMYVTIGLGIAFLLVTGYEWRELILRRRLVIQSKRFRHDLFHGAGFSRDARNGGAGVDGLVHLASPSRRHASHERGTGVVVVVLAPCRCGLDRDLGGRLYLGKDVSEAFQPPRRGG